MKYNLNWCCPKPNSDDSKKRITNQRPAPSRPPGGEPPIQPRPPGGSPRR